jgi:molecular chaperone HtpG
MAPDEHGRVDITIDSGNRIVRIRDNGSGVARKDFGRKLTAIGASAKRGTPARGFRGVGRLAGLGYAQELIFRSRIAGEPLVSELRWDCRRLKTALRSAEADSGVRELIRSVVSIQRIDAGEYPERFFEVELKGIVRLKSDRLMSPVAVGEYLSQVAPVPFAPEFKFGAEITAALRSLVALGELDLRVDGFDTPIYRPHRNEFVVDDKHTIAFEGMDIIEIPGIDGEVAAVAWILHHEYEGAVPNGTLVKGLRLRSGNVQVGDHALLEELYPEPRFNVWSVGEIHVIDRRIVPNGRRDHFEQNAHFHNLINQLSPTARDIARRCRTSSVKRKWLREFELHRDTVRETIGIIKQGSVGKPERERLALSAEQALLQMGKIAGMDVLVSHGGEEAQATIRALKGHLGKVMKDEVAVSSPLMRLPKVQRKTYEHFFELIYQCSANRVAAKALIDRILLQLE